MTKETIIQKLAKLKKHAESAEDLGNAAEAEAFMAKFRELLVKHELTMSEVEYANLPEKDPLGKTRTRMRTRKRRLWQERLASSIAKLFFCRILVVRGSDAIIFIGRKTHRECAEYVYTRLRNELADAARREYKRLRSRLRRNGEDLSESHAFKPAFRNAYIREVTKRINQRLAAERERIEASETSGVALVRLTDALTKTDDFIDSLDTVRMKSLRGRAGSNALGRERGSEYGRRANLSTNGVGGGSSTPSLKEGT